MPWARGTEEASRTGRARQKHKRQKMGREQTEKQARSEAMRNKLEKGRRNKEP
jgi:hypothetical protein